MRLLHKAGQRPHAELASEGLSGELCFWKRRSLQAQRARDGDRDRGVQQEVLQGHTDATERNPSVCPLEREGPDLMPPSPASSPRRRAPGHCPGVRTGGV